MREPLPFPALGEEVGAARSAGSREKEDGAVDAADVVDWDVLGVGEAIVVDRVRLVVSADGGGGREAAREARQRKHSPLPK